MKIGIFIKFNTTWYNHITLSVLPQSGLYLSSETAVSASGFHSSADSLHPNASGEKPKTVDIVVINMGRKRSDAAVIIALTLFNPLARNILV